MIIEITIDTETHNVSIETENNYTTFIEPDFSRTTLQELIDEVDEEEEDE